MRIGTWNVEYAAGADKNAKRMEIIRSNPADIWVLTETHDDLDLTLTHSPVHSHQRPSGRPGARWVSIWTSCEVRHRIDVADPERTVAAMLETPLGLMVVYGTVLPWHTDHGVHPPEVPVASWSEHHRVIPLQSAEWSSLRHRYPHAHICVAGDLNTDVGGKHYYGTKLGRSLLKAAMESNDLVCATSTDRIPEGLLDHPPIDHVLLSAQLGNRSAISNAWNGTQDGIRLSDHSGLVLAITTRDSPEQNGRQMTTRDNKAWQAQLRSAGTGALKSCVVPEAPTTDSKSKPRVRIVGTPTEVSITLNAKAAVGNMQSDASAFEGWSLALIEHCGVTKIRIGADIAPVQADAHVNRLAYRLSRISELVPQIEGELPKLPEPSKRWTINKSGKRAVACEFGKPWAMMRRVKKPLGEKGVEMGLEASPTFRERFGLSNVMRQWPVGVRDLSSNLVLFPGGGGSQADLIGINGDTLCVFELKVGANKKIGALSELFFYSCVLRDVLLGRVEYSSLDAAKNCQIAPGDVVKCKRIRAVVIKDGPHHPLLEEPTIIERINREIAAKWTDFPIQFELARIVRVPNKDGEDFAFAP